MSPWEQEGEERKRVGLIGLGKMGWPMARNLLAAAFPLTVYDVQEGPVSEMVASGATAVGSPREVGERSDIVVIMVPSATVESVILGEVGVLRGIRRGGIVIDGGNCNPKVSQRIAEKAAAEGIAFLDVGVSGGPEGAARATLALMVGGEEWAYRECLPLFRALGTQVTYFGPSGRGHLVKLINNILVSVVSMGIAEALAFAHRFGLDPQEVAQVLNAGVARGWLLELAERIFERPGGIEGVGEPIGGGEQLKWALEMAHELDFPLPLAGATCELKKLSRQVRVEAFAINAALRAEFGGHGVERSGYRYCNGE